MIKTSERFFESVGNSKGKYQNLIHCHCKLLAVLVNNIDSHEFNEDNKAPIISDGVIRQTYHNIIKIFGTKELYLINIGIIELISRKELNYKRLKYFID